MCLGLVFPLSARSRRKSRNRIPNPNPKSFQNPSQKKSSFAPSLSRAASPSNCFPSLSFPSRCLAHFFFFSPSLPRPVPPPCWAACHPARACRARAPRAPKPREKELLSLSPPPLSPSRQRLATPVPPVPSLSRRHRAPSRLTTGPASVRRDRPPRPPPPSPRGPLRRLPPRRANRRRHPPGPAAPACACHPEGERALSPSPRVPLPVLARGPRPFFPLSFFLSPTTAVRPLAPEGASAGPLSTLPRTDSLSSLPPH